MSTTIGLLPNSGRNSSVKAMMKKNSMAFEEKQTNKQTAPLGATKYEKRNDQCFIVLKLALELSKYRYRGYLFVFKIYCSNFILEFQIICLFYLTDENFKIKLFLKKVVFLASKIGFDLYTRSTCTRVYTV